MAQTKEQDIDRFQVRGAGEALLCGAEQIGMYRIDRTIGVAAAVRKYDLRLWMMHEQANEFTPGKPGRTEYPNINFFHSCYV